jgi:hypothetical protein
MPDELKALHGAVKDERTRICSALLKVRFAMLGKAHAQRSNGMSALEAYEDAATMISEFLMKELGAEVTDV